MSRPADHSRQSPQLDFLQALNEITLELLQHRERGALLQALADRAALHLEADQVEVALIEGEELVTHAYGGAAPAKGGARAGRSEAVLSWRAVDLQQPVVEDNFEALRGGSRHYHAVKFQAVAVLPLVVGPRCIGVLGLLRSMRDAPFSPEECRKGMLLAQLAAIVIDNAQIYDATRRQQEERNAALQERERLYRSLVENVSQGNYVADRRGLFTYCNPALCAMGGYTQEELLGSVCFRLITPEDRGRVMRQYAAWSRDPAVTEVSCEFRVITKTGRLVWMEQTTDFLRDPGGRVIEGRNLLRDITERRRAEAALRESEERFRGVFEGSPIPIALLSIPEGRIVELNQAGSTAFGFSREEALGRTSVELGVWADTAERDRYLALLVRDKIVQGFEARMRRRNGEVFTVLYSGSLVTINGRHFSLNSLQDISERKSAEAVRDRSLAINLATLESTADGILVVDHSGRIESYNRAFARMWQIPEALLAEREGARAIHSVLGQLEDPDAFLARIRELYGQPEQESFDILKFKDGRVFERYSRPLLLAGQPAGRVWSFRDDTAARQAESALRESEEQFRAVFDRSPVPVILLSAPGGQILQANQSAGEVFGYTREEVLGKTTLELNIWPDPEDRARILERLQKEGEVQGLPVVMRAKNGRLLTMLYHACRIQIGGRPCLLSTVIDITDRIQAERLFHDLFAFSPDAYLITTTEGIVTDVNERALALFGITREEISGRSWATLVPDEVRPALTARVQAYLANPVAWGMGTSAPGLVARRNDGTVFPIDVSLSPLHLGEETLIVAAVRDITRQLEAEKQQRTLEAELRQTQKAEAIGTLAGGIAHDFNNLLTGILGQAEIARMDLPTGHPAANGLGEIVRISHRARDLVKQILSFSRRAEHALMAVQLPVVVQEALKLLRSTIPPMVRIDFHHEPDCPAVLADPGQMHQVIINLGTNAWHALPEHGGEIKVLVRSVEAGPAVHSRLKPGPHVCLAVADNGKGMNAATLERIFDPFFTTKPAGKGTGLGLAVVQGIVHSHHGAITVRSKPGQGSVFEIYLPVAGTPSSPPVESPGGAAPGSLPRGRGERLLVVDDEESSGTVIHQLLLRLGYQSTYCSDPVEALARLGGGNFAMLVTDLAMPVMTGEILAGKAIARRPGLPVLLISGYLEPGKIEKLRAIGVREVLSKPTSMEDLAIAVQRCLCG